MKQKKVGKKFGLNKTTVANLDKDQMDDVKGGAAAILADECTCDCCTCDCCTCDCSSC